MKTELVRMEHIDKSFSGVQALKGCELKLFSGEVHALVGENGAGKSTLMKILAGVYKKDAGDIFIRGKSESIESPKTAQQLGISIIHQELNLMPHLTVAQNIFVGREPRKKIGFMVDNKAIIEKTTELFKMLHMEIDPTIRVSELTVAKQQMVEIAKALSFNSEVLIMDEPTAALTEVEIHELFEIIHKLKLSNIGIVYISHRMDELKRITDKITIMRDGNYIDTVPTKETSTEQIIQMMVGRTLYESGSQAQYHSTDEVVLEVKGLSNKRIKDVNFYLKKGEILGFAGLMGAGRTEVARAIFGADPIDSGEIFIKQKAVRIKKPKDAVDHGIGYLSEDRKQFGLAVDMDVETNITLASISKFKKPMGRIDKAKIRRVAQEHVNGLKIKTPHTKQIVKNLSGGNQQKVVIGKWLTRDCDILIFDEPTRGIDIGAKSEIYKLLHELVKAGKSIIMISSELPEILRMSNRIIVMCEGKITGELSQEEASQEYIMKFATMREVQVDSNESGV